MFCWFLQTNENAVMSKCYMSVCFPTNKTKEDEKKTTEWKFRCLNLRSLCWEGVGGKSHVDISFHGCVAVLQCIRDELLWIHHCCWAVLVHSHFGGDSVLVSFQGYLSLLLHFAFGFYPCEWYYSAVWPDSLILCVSVISLTHF